MSRILIASFIVSQAVAGVPTHNACLLDDSWIKKIMEKKLPTSNHSYAQLPKGPYAVKTDTITRIPGLSKGGPYAAYIVYAEPQSDGEKFPFISFAHGTTSGGAKLLSEYAVDLETVASYGFIIVAAESCPEIECFSGYCADQQQTIRACKSNPGLHSALANADFSTVGVYGHSMGAMATLGSIGGSRSCRFDASLNIKAAVAQHPCWDPTMQASPVTLPIMFTAGSVDSICEDGCSERFFEQITKSSSKIMYDVKGANHFEPTFLGSNSEVPAVAYFFTCWLRNEQCDKVYGSSGNAICGQMPSGSSLHDCRVVGTKESQVVV
jgi:hypothetical protein